MKNLSIAKKLTVAFGACLLIVLALSAVALTKLSALNQNVMMFAENRMPKAIALGKFDSAFNGYRSSLYRHVATSAATMAEADTDVQAARKAVDDSFQVLQGLIIAADVKATAAEIADALPVLYRDDDAMLVLARRQSDEEASARLLRSRDQVRAIRARSDHIEELFGKQVAIATAEAAASYTDAKLMVAAAVLVGVTLVALLLVAMIRLISVPIGRATDAIGELAAGNLLSSLPNEDRRDEIGKLATSVVRLRDQLAGAEGAKQAQVALIVDSIGTGLDALSHGDLTARIDADLTGPFAKLKTDFNGAMDALGATLSAVSQATGGIHTGATEISQASDDLSRRTEQQAASLEETAAAMDEITATVRETASGAVRANEVVAATRGDAEDGGRVVRQAVDAMGGIERASNEISEIISVIDGIAFQTNLLALNAGVEAARAGDAGRGFAVVASEVRALAQRSAEAAKDVKTKITASAGQVEIGVALVGETGQALERIVARIGEISQLVSNITTSAEQQASGLQQVNTAVGEMDSVTQQNAAMVEQSTAAARSLAAEAEDLARHVARFRIGTSAGQSHSAAATPRAAPAPAAPARKVVARRPATNGALALKVEHDADDWSQF